MGSDLKLTFAQSTLLRLITETCASFEGSVWIPPRSGLQSLDDAQILVSGSGVAMAFKALVKKGLIVEHPLCGYAAKVTEAGKVAAEAEEGKPLMWVYKRPMGFEE